MTKSIVIHHGKETTDDEYCSSFPPFLWLLRDAFVKMPEVNGKELTPTEYLITEVLGDNPGSMEVAVHRALKKFFPSFVCKMLSTPTANKDVMRDIVTKQKRLTDSFNDEVDQLIAFLKTNVKPKQVFSNAGASCDGCTLAKLVEQVAKEVNDPMSIPALDNTWNLVVQSRCRDVQKKLIAEYCTTIKTRYDSASKGGPLEEEVESSQEQCASVIGIHNKLWAEIKEKFQKELRPLLSVPVSEECTLQSVTNELENELVQFQLETSNSVRKVNGGALYTVIAEENQKRSREYCNKIFTDLYTKIRRRVESAEKGYTVETLEADIDNLWQEYDSKSVGPEKMYIRDNMEHQIEENRRMLQEWLQRAQDRREVKELYKKIDTKLEEQNEKRIRAEEERREKVEKQLEETQKSLDVHKKQLNEETHRLMEEKHKREKAEGNIQQMTKTLEERQQIAKVRLDEEKKRTEKAEERLEKVTDERDKLKVQLTEATLMKEHAEEKLADERKRHADLIKDKDIEITKQTTMANETKKELDEQKKEKEEHKKRAEQLTKEIDEKTKEAKKLTEDIDEKTKEAKKLTEDINEKTKEVTKLTKDVDKKTREAEDLTQYIDNFESSGWFTRMFWVKRQQRNTDNENEMKVLEEN